MDCQEEEKQKKKKSVCIHQQQDSTLFLDQCTFKSLSIETGYSIGIFNNSGNLVVQNCQFNMLIYGAMFCLLKHNNIFVCRDNAFISCHTAGIYVQGQSQPIICQNVFMMNKCPAIVLSNHTDAFVAINEFQINNNAAMIINNNSTVYGNKIQKSNDTGILVHCCQIAGETERQVSCPLIIRNYIEHSMHNGI